MEKHLGRVVRLRSEITEMFSVFSLNPPGPTLYLNTLPHLLAAQFVGEISLACCQAIKIILKVTLDIDDREV